MAEKRPHCRGLDVMTILISLRAHELGMFPAMITRQNVGMITAAAQKCDRLIPSLKPAISPRRHLPFSLQFHQPNKAREGIALHSRLVSFATAHQPSLKQETV